MCQGEGWMLSQGQGQCAGGWCGAGAGESGSGAEAGLGLGHEQVTGNRSWAEVRLRVADLRSGVDAGTGGNRARRQGGTETLGMGGERERDQYRGQQARGYTARLLRARACSGGGQGFWHRRSRPA